MTENILVTHNQRLSVRVPNLVDTYTNLSYAEFRALVTLYACADGVLPRRPSSAQLAALCGVEIRHMRRVCRKLEDLGLARITPGYGRTKSVIQLDERWSENAAIHQYDRADGEKYYTTVPLSMLIADDLEGASFRLLFHYRRVGRTFEANSTTCESAGIGLRQLKEAKRSLSENGWIEIDARSVLPMPVSVERYAERYAQIMASKPSFREDISELSREDKKEPVQSREDKKEPPERTFRNHQRGQKGTTREDKKEPHNNKTLNNKTLNNKSVNKIDPLSEQEAVWDGDVVCVGEQHTLSQAKEKETEEPETTFGRTIPADDNSDSAFRERVMRSLDVCAAFISAVGNNPDVVYKATWMSNATNAEQMFRPASEILSMHGYDVDKAIKAMSDMRLTQLQRNFYPRTLAPVWVDIKAAADKRKAENQKRQNGEYAYSIFKDNGNGRI